SSPFRVTDGSFMARLSASRAPSVSATLLTACRTAAGPPDSTRYTWVETGCATLVTTSVWVLKCRWPEVNWHERYQMSTVGALWTPRSLGRSIKTGAGCRISGEVSRVIVASMGAGL